MTCTESYAWRGSMHMCVEPQLFFITVSHHIYASIHVHANTQALILPWSRIPLPPFTLSHALFLSHTGCLWISKGTTASCTKNWTWMWERRPACYSAAAHSDVIHTHTQTHAQAHTHAYAHAHTHAPAHVHIHIKRGRDELESSQVQSVQAQYRALARWFFEGVGWNCTTLQHTATHCNTLQHSATHCKRPTQEACTGRRLLFPVVYEPVE